MFEPISPGDEEIAKVVVNGAFRVHKALGPGLLESVYEVCLAHELRKGGLEVRRQDPIPIVYDNIRFEEGVRFDLLVPERVLCEIKAVQEVHPVCIAQILAYLTLMNLRLGFVIDFNVPLIKEGIQRIVR